MASDDSRETFTLELKDEMSGAASTAASALDTLHDSLDRDTKSLAEMQRAMKRMQAGSSVNVETYRKLSASMAATRERMAQTQTTIVGMGGSLTRVKSQARVAQSGFEQLAQQAQSMPGPLGVLVSRFQSLAKVLTGGGMKLALVAISAALVGLAAASAKAASALYTYGVAQANARRSELLRLQGLSKIRTLFGQYFNGLSQTAGSDMQGMLDRVSSSTALGRDQLAKYTEQLYKMGVRGANLEHALEGVAIKASTQGDEQASMFARWAAGAHLAGRSVEALTSKVKDRLGGIAKAQLLDWDVQTRKLQENFSSLFNDVKIAGLLKARASLFSLFDQSTASGKALKALLERLLEPLINKATAALPIVKGFFQDLIIMELRLEIAYLRLRNALRKAFDTGDLSELLGELSTPMGIVTALAGALGVALLLSLAPAIWSVVAATGAWLVQVAVIAAPFLLAVAAVWGFVKILQLAYEVWKNWDDIDFAEAGAAMIEGIVDGLKSGFTAVKDTVTELATGAWSSFKEALGIASPSKVFAELGYQIPQGVAQGVEQGSPDAAAAVDSMVSVPAAPQSDASTDGARSVQNTSTRSASVTIGELHVHASSGSGDSEARDIAIEIKREIERVLEGVALQMGAA